MIKTVKNYISTGRVTSLLTELVNIPSTYFNEKDAMDFVYHWLKKRNLNPKFHDYHEHKVTKFDGINVIGNLKGHRSGPKIYLNGHLDTVNPCNGWKTDPFKASVIEDRLYGLGALDMKAGVAAIMIALEAFKALNRDFGGEIIYSIVSEEEGPFGLGTDAIIRDGLVENIDVAIVTEPSSGFCKKPFPCVCLGARGGFNYTVTLTGKSAHAANPEEGINAVVECAKIILELEKSILREDEKLGKGSICILGCNGPDEVCSVPDRASFKVFRHIVNGEDYDYVKKELFEAVERAGVSSQVEFALRDYPYEEIKGFPAYTVEEDNPYVKAFIEATEMTTSKQCNVDYFKSIGDFNYIGTRLNAPTIIFGPKGENYHTANEYVEIDTVVETALVIYEYLFEVLCK